MVRFTDPHCLDRLSSSVTDEREECSTPILTVTPSELYYGARVVGEVDVPPQPVTVHNHTGKIVKIEDVRIVQGNAYFQLAEPNEYPPYLRAGESFNVWVEYRATDVGYAQGLLKVVTDEEFRQPYGIGLSGRIVVSTTVTNTIREVIDRDVIPIVNNTNNRITETNREVDRTNIRLDQTNLELSSQYNGFRADLTEVRWTMANGFEAEAGYRQTLEATLRGVINASIEVERIARVTAISAEASDRLTMGVNIRDEAEANLQSERVIRATRDEAEASERLAMGVTIRQEVSATFEEERLVTATRFEAEASDRLAMGVSIRTDVGADFTEERRVRAERDNAEATAREALDATLRSTITASVEAERVARVNAIAAEATAREALEVSFSRMTGGGGNVLQNTEFVSPQDNVIPAWYEYNVGPEIIVSAGLNIAGDLYRPRGENVLSIRGNRNSEEPGSSYCGFDSEQVPCGEEEYVQVSGYFNAHRASVGLVLYFRNEANEHVSHAEIPPFETLNGLGNNPRLWIRRGIASVRVPDGATRMFVQLRKYGTIPPHSDSYAWFWRIYLAASKEGATTLSPYTPGGNKLTFTRTNARIDEEATARATAISAEASRADSIVASLRSDANTWNNERYNQSLAVDARVTNVESAAASATGAVAGRASTLEAQMRGEVASRLNTEIVNSIARINDVESASITRDNANAGRSSTLEAQMRREVGSDLNNAVAAVDGRVTSEASASASRDSALSGRIDTVSASAGSAYSRAELAISAAATAQSGANSALARAAVRLDVNNYITGWETTNNGNSGAMIIRADNFQIVSPGGGARTEYSGGNWRVYDANGVLRVRMGIW